MDTTLFSLEDHGDIAVVRFKPRESLYAADSGAMIDAWAAFEKVQLQAKSVVVFRMPKDYLSPNLVDAFWRQAMEAPMVRGAGGPARPRMVAAADAAIQRSLPYLKSLPALTIVACEGEIDFDLLGPLLACNYRVCSAETAFVNHTLRRNVVPGSGTPWFLVRLLGYAKVRRLYLGEVSLAANEALDLGIVDQISAADSLTQDALAVAERFRASDPAALSAAMKGLQLTDLDLDTYLKQVGTGFGRVPRSV